VSESDSILCAWIEGTARRLATDATITEADAVAELRRLAAGRADLLAEVAGVGLASAETTRKWRMREAAELCVAARADESQLEHWIAVGQGQAKQAKAVPQTSRKAGRATRFPDDGTVQGVACLPSMTGSSLERNAVKQPVSPGRAPAARRYLRALLVAFAVFGTVVGAAACGPSHKSHQGTGGGGY